ncbi:MAG: hypothetical protein BroJett003_25880 [Planctomycetota bacterium]|nr:MAG: hypothetical protein BroJett003_25880 [Planctomycetota bacterium]
MVGRAVKAGHAVGAGCGGGRSGRLPLPKVMTVAEVHARFGTKAGWRLSRYFA